MREKLLQAAEERGGVITRPEALSLVPRHVLDDAVGARALDVAFPSTYVLPACDGRATRRLAATRYLPGSAVSHVDALDVWRLPTHLGPAIHLTAGRDRTPTTTGAVTLHRRQGFDVATLAVVRDGVPVVRLEQAVVESWPLLPEVDRRVPAIVAVRERRTTAARLADCLARQPRTPGAADLRRLVALLGHGLHSPLELWGHEHVFADRRLPRCEPQLRVRTAVGAVYLDRPYPDILLDIELDGAAYHGEPGQRERDIVRDAALARLGWLVVRFSHLRLHRDPTGVREEAVAIAAVRRRQLASLPLAG